MFVEFEFKTLVNAHIHFDIIDVVLKCKTCTSNHQVHMRDLDLNRVY